MLVQSKLYDLKLNTSLPFPGITCTKAGTSDSRLQGRNGNSSIGGTVIRKAMDIFRWGNILRGVYHVVTSPKLTETIVECMALSAGMFFMAYVLRKTTRPRAAPRGGTRTSWKMTTMRFPILWSKNEDTEDSCWV